MAVSAERKKKLLSDMYKWGIKPRPGLWVPGHTNNEITDADYAKWLEMDNRRRGFTR